MPAAVMACAAVTAAVVAALAVLMVMMIASDIGIVFEIAGKQCLDCCVTGSDNAAVKFDTCLGKRHLGAAADTAADQDVSLQSFQNGGKCAVSLAVCPDDRFADAFSILNIIDLKFLCVAEMLENLFVFVGYCNSHDMDSFWV